MDANLDPPGDFKHDITPRVVDPPANLNSHIAPGFFLRWCKSKHCTLSYILFWLSPRVHDG